MTRLRPALAVVLVALVLTGCGTEPHVGARTPVERVLIVSLPSVGWDDLEEPELENLRGFVDEAAIGDVSTRIGRREAGRTDAYLTIGAGSRAVAPRSDAAIVLEPDEAYGDGTAGDLLRRRLGHPVTDIAYLGIGQAVERNDTSAFGAEVGTLGDHLRDAGVARAVIANADGDEGMAGDPGIERSAALALIGSDGTVPGGAVSGKLLVADPDAPFGTRLDPGAVRGAFDQAWTGGDAARRVVLVEASDLARNAAYERRVEKDRRPVLRSAALASTDALFGDLLGEVDPEHDAVIVVSPVGQQSLGMVAIRAPGTPARMLRSPTTRRDGYVQLADLTPTVLDLLGEKAPDAIEGRPILVGGESGSGRVGTLKDSADAARFRASSLAAVIIIFTAVLVLLAGLTVIRRKLPRGARPAIRFAALAVLGAVAGTFLSTALPPTTSSLAVYLVFISAVGVAVAGVATLIDRRRPGLAPIVATATVVVVIVGDLLTGAHLQLNSIFGYSVAVAGRFAGLGNLGFALLGAATIVLAALIAERWGSTGRALAIALLVGVIVVDGLPMLGADVGGVLSMVPAFGITWLLLAGRKVGWRQVVLLLLAGVVALFAFAFIDLARTEDARTHLARHAQHALDQRWSDLFDSVSRRWQASFGGAELAAWAGLILLLVVVCTYLALHLRRSGRPAGESRSMEVSLLAASAGVGVLALLGLLANDSSFAVPATMLIAAPPVVIYREAGRRDGPDDRTR